jgi:4-hydroxy-3-methylbut-2-en-1-yl diphosphate synthase IspG/GcpE
MAARNDRTPEEVRRELEAERERLAQAVNTLRAGVKDATDVRARIRDNLPVAVGGALAAGFLLAGGIGATIRLLFSREDEGREIRVGRFSIIDRERD